MTARSDHFVIDTQAIKPREVLSHVARARTAAGLTHRLLRDLEQELGGSTRACRWLINVATATGRPITIHAWGGGTRLMSARPYRQCPACGVVRAGSEFKRAPRSGTFGAPAHRRCPACGHVALRTAFPQVKRPLAGESAEDVD